MIHKVWRLSEHEGDDNLGLACTERGLVFGHTSLIERHGSRFAVREQHEIERLLSRAYGTKLVADRLTHGLATVAAALNANDQALARIAAVHLRLPDLSDQTARAAMEAEDRLIKSIDWDPDLHPRTGTGPNAGWFATTGGSAAVRTAQNENSAQRSDASPGNSKPGDRFATADDAAISALLTAWAARTSNLEYAGRIYQNADGSFSYTRALTLSQLDPSLPNRNCCVDFSSPGPVPSGTRAVASYHTHPIEPGFNEAEFSDQHDIPFYTWTDKLPGYLAGANAQGIAEILRFTPGPTISQGISQVLGRISNGAFVPNPGYDPNLKPHIPPPGGDSYDPDRDEPK